MASWRNVAKVAVLGDGHISTKEVEILRTALLDDGDVNKSELEFLQEVRQESKTQVHAFNELFIEAVKGHLLRDGSVDAADVTWLRTAIFADGSADDVEKRLLEELKANSCPELDALCAEVM